MKIVFAFAIVLPFAMASCASKSNQPAEPESAASIDTTAQSAATTADSTAVAQDTMPQLEFEAFDWTLLNFIDPNGKVSPLRYNSTIVVKLVNRKVSGFGGCNNFYGTYTATENGEIRFVELNRSDIICQGLMGQEARFIKLLQGATSWKRDNVELRLSGPEGTLQFAHNIPVKKRLLPVQ